MLSNPMVPRECPATLSGRETGRQQCGQSLRRRFDTPCWDDGVPVALAISGGGRHLQKLVEETERDKRRQRFRIQPITATLALQTTPPSALMPSTTTFVNAAHLFSLQSRTHGSVTEWLHRGKRIKVYSKGLKGGLVLSKYVFSQNGFTPFFLFFGRSIFCKLAQSRDELH
ncbi:unnamed protein product [Ixodes persulcatus]